MHNVCISSLIIIYPTIMCSTVYIIILLYILYILVQYIHCGCTFMYVRLDHYVHMSVNCSQSNTHKNTCESMSPHALYSMYWDQVYPSNFEPCYRLQHTHTCTHAHTHARTRTNTHTHTHTHTHNTQGRWNLSKG